jgi:predicted site-specific integrase-resolvase
MNEIRRNQALYARFKSSKSFQELDSEVKAIEQQKNEQFRSMTE